MPMPANKLHKTRTKTVVWRGDTNVNPTHQLFKRYRISTPDIARHPLLNCLKMGLLLLSTAIHSIRLPVHCSQTHINPAMENIFTAKGCSSFFLVKHANVWSKGCIAVCECLCTLHVCAIISPLLTATRLELLVYIYCSHSESILADVYACVLLTLCLYMLSLWGWWPSRPDSDAARWRSLLRLQHCKLSPPPPPFISWRQHQGGCRYTQLQFYLDVVETSYIVVGKHFISNPARTLIHFTKELLLGHIIMLLIMILITILISLLFNLCEIYHGILFRGKRRFKKTIHLNL